MKIFLIIIIALFWLTACNKESLSNSFISDYTEISSEGNDLNTTEISLENIESKTAETTLEDNSSTFTETRMMINNMIYCLSSYSQTYNLTNAEYIGEFLDEVPSHKAPFNNMTANFPIEGKKIYKISDDIFVVKHEKIINNKSYAMSYREMKLYKSFDNRYIRINNNLFTFPEYNVYNIYNDFESCPEEYDLDKAEYIGDIIEQLDYIYKIPTDHLSSNVFSVNSKVYRIDEAIIIVCYKQNNKKIYSIGRIVE